MGDKCIKDLACVMTDDEKRLKGSELAVSVEELAALDVEKKDFAEKLKARVSHVEKRITKLAHEVKTGKEVRPVECAEYQRYATRMVDLVRLDTGEIVFSRPMRPDEFQTSMEMQQPEGSH